MKHSRHTFGADMVRAGISVPALQHLMGHSQIHTTMLYVQLAPQDVWREYARAVENPTRLSTRHISLSRAQPSLDQIFEAHIQTLALTLRRDTVTNYRCVAHRFLVYLHSAFPQVRRLSQLRRDPHLLGWFRWMCEQDPQLCNKTRIDYLLGLRRLLDDLTANGHAIQPDLIRRDDFPPRPQYLSRPLSPRDDQLLRDQLRRTDDLAANALLLTRAIRIRIGECIDLTLDCLRQLGPDQWALHVPLGKLHTERLVPADAEVRRVVARILALRALPLPRLAIFEGLLLPRYGGHYALYQTLRLALAKASRQAGCSSTVTPHQLRHTFASEMLRLGVGLPALMQLLGHKDIRMTMRYLQVTLQDLQREFHAARQHAPNPHPVPLLSPPNCPTSADPAGIRQAIAATRHLLEMYRRQLDDPRIHHRLRRLDKRLLTAAEELDRITTEK